jgi:CheY-like chemotaxis protein
MVKESPKAGGPAAAPPSRSRSSEPLDAAGAKLAHDIRNPLTIVTTNLDFALCELKAGRTGQELHTAICDARDAAGRISRIADGIGAQSHRPRAQSVSSVMTRVAEPERGDGTIPRTARVLVVDDEPALGAALRRSLRDYDVVVTVSGQEALGRLAQGERFDFILCDLTMPSMGGDELYVQLQRVAPDQARRMVFITGGATTERARTFLENVPNRIIYKPYDVTELREMIRRRLATPER